MPAITGSDDRLSRVIAVINGKGGVGKTSITANTGIQLGLGGYRVLLVDLDSQGDLTKDLGVMTAKEGNDQGRSTFQAVQGDQEDDAELTVIRNVREDVDLLPGGQQLKKLVPLAYSGIIEEETGERVPMRFARKLAELVTRNEYDLVFIDSPPSDQVLQDVALTTARYLLIPSKTDARSWEGLRNVGPAAKRIRRDNPDLTYLGVVVFGHSTSATQVLRATRAKLDEISETVPLFDTYIRHSEATTHDSRNRGQMAHELASDAAAQQSEVFTELRKHRKRAADDNVVALPSRKLSESANSVAGDYRKLAREVLLAVGEAEAAADGVRQGSDA